MATQKDIQSALFRAVKIFTSRPREGQMSKTTTTTIQNGIKCTCEESGRSIEVDMPAVFGGEDSAPNPGFYARAALGSCNAISYAWAFAQNDIPYTHLSVHVECDMDIGGHLGIDGTIRGYPQTRILVELESSADAEVIEAAMVEAESSSPIGHVFKFGSRVTRELSLNKRSME